MIIQQHSNIATATVIQYPKQPYHALTPLPSTRVVIPRLGDSSLLSLCSLPLFAFAFHSSLLCTIVSMNATVALPLVMPGRFGVLCKPSPYSHGPFDEGTHCVTVIPRQAVLRKWARLIVEHWDSRWISWSPHRSVVVRYFDLGEDPLVNGSEEYYHRAGDEGIYDLIAQRQALTMAELFNHYEANELANIDTCWKVHHGGPLVLDGRLPSLADHKAIQRMIEVDFSFQVYNAFVTFSWPERLIKGMVRLCCTEELAAQNREREANLHRVEYTIEGYEHVRFSMVFMRKHPRLEIDAFNGICSFLLGRPIANLHLVG